MIIGESEVLRLPEAQGVCHRRCVTSLRRSNADMPTPASDAQTVHGNAHRACPPAIFGGLERTWLVRMSQEHDPGEKKVGMLRRRGDRGTEPGLWPGWGSSVL